MKTWHLFALFSSIWSASSRPGAVVWAGAFAVIAVVYAVVERKK